METTTVGWQHAKIMQKFWWFVTRTMGSEQALRKSRGVLSTDNQQRLKCVRLEWHFKGVERSKKKLNLIWLILDHYEEQKSALLWQLTWDYVQLIFKWYSWWLPRLLCILKILRKRDGLTHNAHLMVARVLQRKTT